MKVAIKFCGGCDPTFDRVELAEQIKNAAGKGITWVDLNQAGKDAILVICGCTRACPVDELQDAQALVVITNNELSPEIVLGHILVKGQIDEN